MYLFGYIDGLEIHGCLIAQASPSVTIDSAIDRRSSIKIANNSDEFTVAVNIPERGTGLVNENIDLYNWPEVDIQQNPHSVQGIYVNGRYIFKSIKTERFYDSSSTPNTITSFRFTGFPATQSSPGSTEILRFAQNSSLFGYDGHTFNISASIRRANGLSGYLERKGQSSLIGTTISDTPAANYKTLSNKLHPIPANGSKKIVIVGNSHGVDLTYAMITNGLKGDISYLRTTNMCSNFGYTPNSEKDRNYCTKVKEDVLNFSGLKDADIIIVHDNWKVENLIDMKHMLGELRGKTKSPIYVVGPKMSYELSASEIVFEAMKQKNANPEMINAFSEKFYDKSRVSLNQHLNDFFKSAGLDKFNIFYVDALTAQCGREIKCEIISKDKKFEYFDTNHLTLEGSTIFGKNLKENHQELF